MPLGFIAVATSLKSAAALEREEELHQRQNRALMDAYGDRLTLEDMEKAAKIYELR